MWRIPWTTCACGKRLCKVIRPFVNFRVAIGERYAGSAIMIIGGEIDDNLCHGYGYQRVIDGRRVLINDDPGHGGARLGHLRDFTIGAVIGIRISVET